MNQKMIMGMAILLVIVGGLGLLLFSDSNNNPAQPQEIVTNSGVEKVRVVFAVANTNLKEGQIITAGDFKLQSFDLEPGQWTKEESDAGSMQLMGYVALSDITANSRILTGQVAAPGSNAYLARLVSPGNSVFSFQLDSRQAAQLVSIKAGEHLDIYFRYNLIQNDYQTRILQNYDLELKKLGDFNQTKLLPVLNSKKLLYIDANSMSKPISEIANTVKKATKIKEADESAIEGGVTAYVELTDKEIKSIYSIEPFGTFILFPASFKDNRAISTDETLPENIRQLRGKKR